MFRSVVSFVLTLLSFAGTAQSPYWLKTIGGGGQDNMADVKTDDAGNVYAIGEFRGTIDVYGNIFGSTGSSDVILMKTNSVGAIQWIMHCGGVGIDRGLKMCVDNSGTLAVTGQFSGTANIFGTTLTSEAGTLDVFTAKLNMSDGSAVWVEQGGSAYGSDKPYGITIAPNGNITVAGDFSGDATFGGSTITSMIDPNTLLPSVDMFVASYTSTGSFLWLQQGSAKYTDRAIDVVSDASSNLYVCGQFSDTVTFDATHNNTIYNATFVIKLDPAGNEQWYRKCGGAIFQYVRDMQLNAPNELLLCGDLRGTTHFFDTSPNTISANANYAYYLMRIGTDGELVKDTVIGSENPLTVRGLDQRGDSVAVLGEFKCQFTGMSDHYGSGLFMAIGPQDLFVARHRSHDLSFRDAQQFGGIGGKRGGQIASLDNGALVFCGNYEKDLVFPSDGSLWGNDLTVEYTTGANSDLQIYCGDSTYNSYALLVNHGGNDGFLARGYALNRHPYDIWERHDGDPCVTDPLHPCVILPGTLLCADTVFDCYPQPPGLYNQRLYMNMFFPWSLVGNDDPDNIGPRIDFLWSDGTTDIFITPTQDGWYSCTASTPNSCWSWTDSIYVILTPPPAPLITDGSGTNVNAGVFQTQAIVICDTTTWIWYSGGQPSDQVTWYQNGFPTLGDSVLADTAGVYTMMVTNMAGCSELNVVYVQGPGFPLPNVTEAQFTFFLGGDTLNNDTVSVCYSGCATGLVDITWFVDGVPADLPAELTIVNGIFFCNSSPFFHLISTVLSHGFQKSVKNKCLHATKSFQNRTQL